MPIPSLSLQMYCQPWGGGGKSGRDTLDLLNVKMYVLFSDWYRSSNKGYEIVLLGSLNGNAMVPSHCPVKTPDELVRREALVASKSGTSG